ncbi:FAH family protein, partial [Pseudomonas syringae pv. tagetis]
VLARQVEQRGVGETHDYPQLLRELRIQPPLDHPDPAHLLVSGTGLTHLGSAAARDKMHQQSGDEATMPDTMRIFKWGVEGGKPAAGQAGVQ